MKGGKKMTDPNLPKDLKYNKDYSWIKIQGDTATLGIIAPGAQKVNEFVFIMLPKKGAKIKKGEKYVSLEAVKWSGHLSSPLSGEIIDVNEPLYDEPSEINKDAYKNWIAKIKISNPDETKELLSADEIKDWVNQKLI